MSIDWVETEFCKVACCDCREALAEVQVDCVVTDPQYGLAERWTGGTWFTKNVYANDKVEWDSEPSDVRPILELKVPTIIWGGNYFDLPPSRCWLAWVKRDHMPTMADFELAWTNFDRPCKEFYARRSGWNRQHPTEKPLGLMQWCLSFLPDAETVFDPFMGSGTTAIACIRTGRKFIGCEIDRKYFDIALKRIREAEGEGSLFPPAQAAGPALLFDDAT